jgi:hypothetical protein
MDISYGEKCILIIKKLINEGVTPSTNIQKICRLPDNFFCEYILSNNIIVSNELEIECAKRKSSECLEFVQENLLDKNIILTDPSILFMEAYKNWNMNIITYLIHKIPQNENTFNKLIILLSIFNESKHLNIIPDDFILSEECTLLLIIMNHKSEYAKKYFHPNIIKYISINFYAYFNPIRLSTYQKKNDCTEICTLADNINVNSCSYENFMKQGSILLDQVYTYNTRYGNEKTIALYKSIILIKKDLSMIDDNVYTDLINKLSLLLDELKSDESLFADY